MTNPVKKLYLVRHAQPAIAKGICYGCSDIAVEAKPEQDLINALRLTLAHDTLIAASPLQRCLSTANALHALGWAEPIVDDRLAEMDFGDWEGVAWNDIERSQIDAWAEDIVNYRPPGGESVKDVATRALSAMADLSFDEDVALITHAGVIQILTKLLRKQALEDFSSKQFEFGSITLLERSIDSKGIVTFSLASGGD